MQEIEAVRGDDNIYSLTVVRNNVAIPISGAKLWFTAKLDEDDPDSEALIKLNSVDNSDQITITDALHGIAQIHLKPADTVGLTQTALHYDVQMRETTNRVTTVAAGIMRIEKDVTATVA